MSVGEFEPSANSGPSISVPTGEYTPAWTVERGGGRGVSSHFLERHAELRLQAAQSPETELPRPVNGVEVAETPEADSPSENWSKNLLDFWT